MKYFKILFCLSIVLIVSSCGSKSDDVKPVINEPETLIEFAVPENYIKTDEAYWIFISDKTGKVWDTKQLTNGQTYSYTTTNNEVFPDETVTVSIFQYNHYSYGDYSYTDTYVNLPKDKYRFHNVVATPTLPPTTGNATLRLSDTDLESFNDWGFFLYGKNMSYNLDDADNGLTFNFTLHSAHNPVLFVNMEDVDYKYFFLDLAPNDNIVKTKENDFLPMAQQNFEVPSGYASGKYLLFGYKGEDFLFADGETLSGFDGVTFPIQYPPNVLDTYYTGLTFYSSTGSVAYTVNGVASIPSSAKIINGSITSGSVKDNAITYATTGTVDYVSASGVLNNDEADQWQSWDIYSGDKSGTIIVPEIPSEIKSKYSWLKPFHELNASITITDDDSYSNYSDLIKDSYQSDAAKNDHEILQTQLYITPTNGRLNPAELSSMFNRPQPNFKNGLKRK